MSPLIRNIFKDPFIPFMPAKMQHHHNNKDFPPPPEVRWFSIINKTQDHLSILAPWKFPTYALKAPEPWTEVVSNLRLTSAPN